MYGFEAIRINNGWAIAVVGITIVFMGLCSLSFIISRLYKLLDFYEHRKNFNCSSTKKNTLKPENREPSILFTDEQKINLQQFALLVKTMKGHLSLPKLLHLAKVIDLKDPHENLHHLLASGIIAADDNGWFCWDQELFDKIIATGFEKRK